MDSNLSITTERKVTAIQAVLWLSWFTIFYNVLEGVVSMYFGIEETSVSLFGFGVDSFIEAFSALFVLWRFRQESLNESGVSGEKEKKASLAIGGLFLLLAGLTAIFSILQLMESRHPSTTLPGTIISVLSLSFMYFLWSRKRRLGLELKSPTVLNDAACSLACIKLSVVLLVGSALFYLMPTLWWADSVAALVMSYFIFQEGQAIREHAKNGDGYSCCEGDK